MQTSLDHTLTALADPTRRAILQRLAQGEARVTELADPFAMSLNGVSKHIRMLERADLGADQRAAALFEIGQDYLKAGILDRVPRMLGVQAAGVAPIAYALEHGALPRETSGNSIADGINVAVPRNWRKAIHAVRASGGAIVSVSDDEMLAALAQAGRHGVFAEPAAAAGVAGVAAAMRHGIITSNDRVLVVITGSGLKDTVSAMKAVGQPIQIEANLDAVETAVDNFRRVGRK